MKKILPLLLLVIGAGAGVGAGLALKPKGTASTSEGVHGGEAAHEETAADEKNKTPDAGHETAAKSHDADHLDEHSASSPEYLRLDKQFVIPLIHKEEITGLVTVALSLEAASGLSDTFFSKEPKLRAAFLQALFDHANLGGFNGAFTRPSKLDPLRTALLEVARRELGHDKVYKVLIVDIARQDHS